MTTPTEKHRETARNMLATKRRADDPAWYELHDTIAQALATAEAEGRRAAFEEAAKWHEKEAADYPHGNIANGRHLASAHHHRALAKES